MILPGVKDLVFSDQAVSEEYSKLRSNKQPLV